VTDVLNLTLHLTEKLTFNFITFIMKHLLRILGIIIISLGIYYFVSCTDDSTSSSNLLTFTAILNGKNEIPVHSSMATGKATLIFNNETKTLSISMIHSVDSPTFCYIKIDKTTEGENDTFFNISNLNSPISYTSPPLSTSQEANLKSNLCYINIGNAANPNGEIRGQIVQYLGNGY
jgi:hypothetical protein